MKSIYIPVLAVFLFTQACTSSKDKEVSPSVTVPGSVVESIKDKYPSASDIKFSVLEDGKVYKADFAIAGKGISVISNRNQILNSFEESDQQAVVSAELNGLDINNGNLSGLRTLEAPGQAARQVGDYFLRGVRYRLTVNSSGDITIATRKLLYETKALEDLPDKIQTYIKKRNVPNGAYTAKLPLLEKQLKDYLADKNELTFNSSSTYLLPDNSRQYQVLVKYYGITDLPLIFDEHSNLIWVGSFNRLESLTNFDDISGGSSNLSQEEVSYFANQFKGASELKDYKFDGPLSRGQAALNRYENQAGYEFRLSKPSENSDESWVLWYDSNKKLVESYYSGQRK